jgi:hypothetical protein
MITLPCLDSKDCSAVNVGALHSPYTTVAFSVDKQPLYRPEQAMRAPGVRLPGFLDSWYMNVAKLSALAPAVFTPQGIFLVLISLIDWVDPRVILRPEGLCQWKVLVDIRLVAQCFNLLRHRALRRYRIEISDLQANLTEGLGLYSMC